MLTSERRIRRWELAPLAGRSGAAADHEAGRKRAEGEGYQAGYRAGLAAAEALARRLGQLLASTENGVRLMEERLSGELLDMAVELARQVVRAEVALKRETVLPVVREALAALSQEARAVNVVAHPADAELLRKHLAEEIAESGWRLVEDHRVEPGGVRVLSSTGDVDATLETRWRRALSALGQDHAWHESAD
jgi:flagellar assembly protein FliH